MGGMTENEQNRADRQRYEDIAHDQEQRKSPQSSAMVIVLGLVALVSMVFGFILGKIF